MKKGMTLLELLVGLAIISILVMLSVSMLRNIMQKSRVVSAKAQIAHIAQALEMVKDDTGKYPVSLSFLEHTSPPPGMERGWRGSYSQQIPRDPWGTPYFYMIPPTEILDPPPIIVRNPGPPTTTSIPFEAFGGEATIRVENYGIAAATIDINGERIFSPMILTTGRRTHRYMKERLSLMKA